MLPTKLFVPCKNALAYKRQGFSTILLFKYQHDLRRGLGLKLKSKETLLLTIASLRLHWFQNWKSVKNSLQIFGK
jgi:hypothetical protein